MLLNVSIDESSDVACGSARLGRSLRNGQFVQQLIEHLDGFLVLALLSSGIRGCAVHDFDRGHGFYVYSSIKKMREYDSDKEAKGLWVMYEAFGHCSKANSSVTEMKPMRIRALGECWSNINQMGLSKEETQSISERERGRER